MISDDEREARAREDVDYRLMVRALENSWQDGKSRERLQRVMQGRLNAMARLTPYRTVDAMRVGDREQYRKFLAGCRAACVRDGLIASGDRTPEDLERMKNRELDRRHYGATTAFEEDLAAEAGFG